MPDHSCWSKTPAGHLTGQNVYREYGFFYATYTAAVLLDGDPGSGYLTLPCLVSQLLGQLVELRESGRTQRMAFRFQTARCVDRHLSSE